MTPPINTFKQALTEKRTQLGLFVGLGNPDSTELLAHCGYDFLMLCAEHGPNDLRTLQAQLRATEAYPVQCLVRPPSHDPALIKQILGIGAQTLLVPMVDTVDQAQALVRAVLYPPRGIRGVGTGMERASRWNGLPAYFEHAEANTCLIVQIETQTALNNLEAIAAVDGVDALFIGPSDLAASLGYVGEPDHPVVREAITTALSRIAVTGKAAGVYAPDQTFAQSCRAAGAAFVALGTDAGLLRQAATHLLQQVKAQTEP